MVEVLHDIIRRNGAGEAIAIPSVCSAQPDVFPRLAILGFAFQKVGPALTFAFREALYACDQLRQNKGALRGAMEGLMVANPAHWQGHYHGDAQTLTTLRHEGLADRIRYYLPQHQACVGIDALRQDIERVTVSDAAFRSVFDTVTLDRAEALEGSLVQRLIDAKIQLALDPYFFKGAA